MFYIVFLLYFRRVNPSALLREARVNAGLTQAALAERLGVSQPSIAALERPGANPTVRTLERILSAVGLELTTSERRLPDVDEGQIRAHLAMTPAERLETFQRSQRNLVELVRKAQRVAPPA